MGEGKRLGGGGGVIRKWNKGGGRGMSSELRRNKNRKATVTNENKAISKTIFET